MKIDRQVDIIEEVLQRAYSQQSESELPTPSSAWKTAIMEQVREYSSPEDVEVEIIEKKFLYLSWIAAGIAAALIIISTMTFALQQDNLESDINELYADNTLDNLTIAMVEK